MSVLQTIGAGQLYKQLHSQVIYEIPNRPVQELYCNYVGKKNGRIVAALIKEGANVNLVDKIGKTALNWAALWGMIF